MLMVSYDISDAYISVSIHKSHKVFLLWMEREVILLPSIAHGWAQSPYLYENTKTNILYIKIKVLLIHIS